ncbi:hypothetical protein HLB44_10755 [Aquincola sp. S2]|uniref:Uncharacterized protein n=1 Tax=Pseudaquabacterium terrae TaxID=2732868 RepID=A0ABX2EFU8_9BURK|nr:hypothetical protein [Aquabacterium terrae]NRF67465.1 hypothetical protein [Aquabacterium terrae]
MSEPAASPDAAAQGGRVGLAPRTGTRGALLQLEPLRITDALTPRLNCRHHSRPMRPQPIAITITTTTAQRDVAVGI